MRIHQVVLCWLLVGSAWAEDGNIRDFDFAPPSHNQPVVRLIQSTHVTLSGYQPATPVETFIRVEGDRSADIKLLGNDFTHIEKVVELAGGCANDVVRELNNLE